MIQLLVTSTYYVPGTIMVMSKMLHLPDRSAKSSRRPKPTHGGHINARPNRMTHVTETQRRDSSACSVSLAMLVISLLTLFVEWVLILT